MALDRIINIVLRAAELVFATIVAGVTGQHLHQYRHASNWSQGRWIYTEVIAALSMFFSLIWLIPFSWSFVHWPVDIILSLCWWAAFGLLVNVSLCLFFLSYMIHTDQKLTLCLDAGWLLWLHLRLEQRPPHLRRSVRQVQGRHCLYVPVRSSLARVCSARTLLGHQPWTSRYRRCYPAPEQPPLVPPKPCLNASYQGVSQYGNIIIHDTLTSPTSTLSFSWFSVVHNAV